jgi:hypothetical protein
MRSNINREAADQHSNFEKLTGLGQLTSSQVNEQSLFESRDEPSENRIQLEFQCYII